MKTLVFVMVALITLVGSPVSSQGTEKPAITLEQLQKMFVQMRAEAPWNVEGPLLWGYFFTDRNAEKLKPVGALLEKQGYRLVNIYPTDDRSSFFLHVEKIERHTPESLNVRNQDFYRLARAYKLDSYDGMDVGPGS